MLSFDPERAPVIEESEALSPIPPERLTPEQLRRRFREQRDWQPEVRAVEDSVVDRALARAAVLVPLVTRDPVTILLTRRNSALRNHAGEISFPGGGAEPGDPDAVTTALREAEEETGLQAEDVEIIGCLPVYATISAFQVTPVAGLVRPGFMLHPDPGEVSEVFEVPLAFLMDPAHHRRHSYPLPGGSGSGQFFSMPYEDGQQRYFIWGVTAGILRNLYRFLAV